MEDGMRMKKEGKLVGYLATFAAATAADEVNSRQAKKARQQITRINRSYEECGAIL